MDAWNANALLQFILQPELLARGLSIVGDDSRLKEFMANIINGVSFLGFG
jgi:hypothetical protein